MEVSKKMAAYNFYIILLKAGSVMSLILFIGIVVYNSLPGDYLKWNYPLVIENKSSKKLEVLKYREKRLHNKGSYEMCEVLPGEKAQQVAYFDSYFDNFFDIIQIKSDNKLVAVFKIYRDFNNTYYPYTIIIPDESKWRTDNDKR